MFDTEDVARSLDPAWTAPTGGPRAAIAIECDSADRRQRRPRRSGGGRLHQPSRSVRRAVGPALRQRPRPRRHPRRLLRPAGLTGRWPALAGRLRLCRPDVQLPGRSPARPGTCSAATLAAILLGPWVGTLVVSVVVIVQALVFADGGLTALGYNVVNMADRARLRRVGAVPSRSDGCSRPTRSGVIAATALAAGVSVVLAADRLLAGVALRASAPVPVRHRLRVDGRRAHADRHRRGRHQRRW